MALTQIPTQSISVKVTGELSGEELFGDFKIRVVLSHAMQLERDRLRREFLGGTPGASLRADSAAEIFSDLMVSIIESPSWWKDSNNGLNLIDDNIPAAVYGELSKARNAFVEARTKKAEAAKKDLEAVKKE